MASVDLTDPQSLNLYTYARNNPIDLIDPSGLYSGYNGSNFRSLYAFFGSDIANLPGFGTEWGSMSDFYLAQYEERVDNAFSGRGFLTNEEYIEKEKWVPQDAGVIAVVDVNWVNGKYDIDNVKWDFRDISLDALILSKPKHYSLKSGVTLTSQVESQVSQLADHYYAITGQDIVVTSGTRSARSQAKAMYGKLAAGGNLNIYTNRSAASQILSAFTNGKSSGKTSTTVITDMTNVIQNQVNKGTYISKHLRSGAVDIRSWNMTSAQKSVFRTIASNFASAVLLERRPPHWHLQF